MTKTLSGIVQFGINYSNDLIDCVMKSVEIIKVTDEVNISNLEVLEK